MDIGKLLWIEVAIIDLWFQDILQVKAKDISGKSQEYTVQKQFFKKSKKYSLHNPDKFQNWFLPSLDFSNIFNFFRAKRWNM